MRALVTGALGGIGSAVVDRLVGEGYEVIAQDVREPRSEELRDQVAYLSGDLLSPQGIDGVQAALGHDGLDCAVAAHGIAGPGAIAALTRADVDRIMGVDFLSVVRLFGALEGNLRRAGGSFVVVASQAGLQGEPNGGAYCAAKFALVGWTRKLAERQGPSGVRVRALCPGQVDTPLLRSALQGMADGEGITLAELTARRLRRMPVGRLGRPADMADAVLHLTRLATSAFVLSPVTGGEVLL